MIFIRRYRIEKQNLVEDITLFGEGVHFTLKKLQILPDVYFWAAPMYDHNDKFVYMDVLNSDGVSLMRLDEKESNTFLAEYFSLTDKMAHSQGADFQKAQKDLLCSIATPIVLWSLNDVDILNYVPLQLFVKEKGILECAVKAHTDAYNRRIESLTNDTFHKYYGITNCYRNSMMLIRSLKEKVGRIEYSKNCSSIIQNRMENQSNPMQGTSLDRRARLKNRLRGLNGDSIIPDYNLDLGKRKNDDDDKKF